MRPALPCVALLACSGDTLTFNPLGPQCTTVSQACREVEGRGIPEADACYALAQDADEAVCSAESARCILVCASLG